jgi:hypothetical protein
LLIDPPGATGVTVVVPWSVPPWGVPPGGTNVPVPPAVPAPAPPAAPPSTRTSSTRRLSRRPSGVRFGATGRVLAAPSAPAMRPASIPSSATRRSRTWSARRRDRSRLAASSPVLSVCPTMLTVTADSVRRNCAISSSCARDSGRATSAPTSK